jgi:hypothetical protein
LAVPFLILHIKEQIFIAASAIKFRTISVAVAGDDFFSQMNGLSTTPANDFF